MVKYSDPTVIRLLSIFELISPETKQSVDKTPIEARLEGDYTPMEVD
eukprot:CAMPEP_0168313348 /NCGR_PEP_ID=MMETSP0210-20121227/1506_1 /TAXON_ID=40633 /ORGANISM="Condylostoma magnum, Strain COL2" /LENGTH=46 /DNA_ID= /DNA_START= /DNA_END= /DNA_ORIENTATION=